MYIIYIYIHIYIYILYYIRYIMIAQVLGDAGDHLAGAPAVVHIILGYVILHYI